MLFRGSMLPTAVLESVSLDKFIPETPSAGESGDASPCRSPSTPRHLRYRQPGGKLYIDFIVFICFGLFLL